MKALLIDPKTKTIEEIQIEKGINAIYEKLECRDFSCPIIFENKDAMYCDGESLFLPDEDIHGGIFYPETWAYPIINKILIMGTDKEGESIDCKSTPDDILHSKEFGEMTWITQTAAQNYARQFK